MVENIDSVKLVVTNPHEAVSLQLIQHLIDDICKRYNEEFTDSPVPEGVSGPGGAFVVAYVGSAPVGCGGIRPVEDGMAEIKRIFVEPEFRGRRIAQRVMEKLEEIAREMGYAALKLETGREQPEAMRLYERMGYTPIPCYPPYQDELSVCYRKELHTYGK